MATTSHTKAIRIIRSHLSAMTPALQHVLQHPAIWRVGQLGIAMKSAVATEYAALDRALPNHGWANGELTEILANEHGIGELTLVMPAIRQVTQSGRSVVLVAPPLIPFPVAWEAQRIRLDRLVIIRAVGKDLFWATEQAAKSGACAMVIAWGNNEAHARNDKALRRLHVAADIGKTALLLYRPSNAISNPSPAPTRLVVSAQGGQLQVQIAKRRGAVMAETIALNLHPPHWQSRTLRASHDTVIDVARATRATRDKHDVRPRDTKPRDTPIAVAPDR